MTYKRQLQKQTSMHHRLLCIVLLLTWVGNQFARAASTMDAAMVQCILEGGRSTVVEVPNMSDPYGRAMTYVKQHPQTTVPLLETALGSLDSKVRERALFALMEIPTVGVKYVREGLKSSEPMIRDWSLTRGLLYHSEVEEFAELFFQRLAETTSVEDQFNVLKIGSVLSPKLLSAKHRETYRLAWERQASANSFAESWVMPLVKYRDDRTTTFLTEMARSQAGQHEGGVDYARLTNKLACGLAIMGDSNAISFVAGSIKSGDIFDKGFQDSFDCGCSELSHQQQIQEALLSLIPDRETFLRLKAEAASHPPSSDTESVDEVRLRFIYRAVRILASTLEVPLSKRKTAEIGADDVEQIRQVAVDRLSKGIKGGNN